MPTRYYLVAPALVRAVSRLEAAGGVDRAEREIDAEADRGDARPLCGRTRRRHPTGPHADRARTVASAAPGSA